MLILLALFAVAAQPVDSFAHAHPASARVTAGPQAQLVHASGFLDFTHANDPEGAAREFLVRYGSSFGVTARQTLVLKQAPQAGQAGPVRFERQLYGLPVFGRDLVLGVDGQERVFLVNTAAVGDQLSGTHALGETAVRRLALSSLGVAVRGVGPIRVSRGWRSLGSSLRAAYRAEFIASKPAGDFRVLLDGETGKLLLREDLRTYATAPGSVYEVSPVETAAARCALSGNALSFCASPVSVTLQNLNSTAALVGTQTKVYNCKGLDAPTSAVNIPGSCSTVSSSGGAFNFSADTSWKSLTDDFSATMAYHHLDSHVSYFKTLDPTLPGGSGRAIRASLPALVNSYQAGAPLENAFFSGGLDAMVFGQGADGDYAYDATVMYHEFTHGVVHAWGSFGIDIDAQGGLDEPGAVNEGTADSMAVAMTGRSQIGSFLSATFSPTTPYLRDLADPTAKRSCHGDGTVVKQFGVNAINGLNGEVHDDGEIWNGFFWEVFQGLKTASVKGCGGACEAAPALQYKALQLAAGGSPQYSSYWQTFKSAATTLFPSKPEVAVYVDCVAKRRGLDKCDRTVPVYAGETKVQYVRLRYSPFQMVFTTTGAAQLTVCSANGDATTAWLRKNTPVTLSSITNTGDANVTADTSSSFTQACSAGHATLTLPSAGTWYVLFDAPDALSPGDEIYKVVAGSTGFSSRPSVTAPPTCAIAGGPLAISPKARTAAPSATIAFSGSGGSGTGYVWTLSQNDSGGTINSSTGAYKAGPTGPVTDTVKLTDSAGATTTTTVSVTASLAIEPGELSLLPGDTELFTATGGSGSGYVFTLTTAGSGGNILASGAYTAGIADPSSDVVKVTDSLGNTASATVSISSPGGCGSLGTSGLLGLLGLVPLLARRRERAARG